MGAEPFTREPPSTRNQTMSDPIEECPECNTPLVNIPSSGAACPGCGKSGILPRISKDTHKAALRAIQVGRLPVAIRLKYMKAVNAKEDGFLMSAILYVLPGRKEIWRRVERCKPSSLDPASAASGAIMAHDPTSGRVIELTTYDAAMEEVKLAIKITTGTA